MATGVPKTQWNGQVNDTPHGYDDVQLTYAGKQSKDQILSTDPAKIVQLWPENEVMPNRLYFGDNLPILASLLQEPSVAGQVRLIYIDPPFSTKSVFHSRSQREAYTDLRVGAHYLEFLRERLILLRELLAPDGSIYVHLDDKMAFYVKVIMDEIFGRDNFRNWITRKKCNPKNYTRKQYGNVADYILFYSKTDNYIWNRPVEKWTEERSRKEYEYVDSDGRRYKKVPVHAPGVRNGETGLLWRGKSPPPGKHWQYPPRVLDEMDARGEIYWSPNGNPRRKIYLEDSVGVPVQDIWLGFRDAHNQNIRITGYPTEKNPALLSRLVEASSNPGDLVLDCFSGSGTTLAVASDLQRKWIGVDGSLEAIVTTLKRFAQGILPMGDFVGRKNTNTQSELQLFRITDFTLFTSEAVSDDLLAAVRQWEEWMPDS